MDNKQTCTCCGQDKPLDDFYQNGKRKHSNCKVCIVSKNRNYYYRVVGQDKELRAKYRHTQKVKEARSYLKSLKS